MVDQNRNKYLTEAMGLEYIKTITRGKFGDCIHYREPNGEDYIVMAGVFFFLLWEWAQDQEWWGMFVIDGKDSDKAYIFLTVKSGAYLHVEDINPDRFANAVYDFLKARS
jgi:hypothetical protein